MSQMHRFIFLICILVFVSTLLYVFNYAYRPKVIQQKKMIPSPTSSISPTLIPTAPADHWEGYESIDKEIEGQTYHLLVADTPEKEQLGLMYITELDGYDGMIFIFDDLSIKSFWNQNTLVDLQILWMNGDTVIGKEILPSIYKTIKPKTISSPGPANTVVELLVTK